MKRALAQIKHHPSRFGALLLAIAISVGFVTTTLVFVETESGSTRDQVAAPASEADVVVTVSNAPYEDESSYEEWIRTTETIADRLAAAPGVEVVAPVLTEYAQLGGSSVELTSTPPEQLQWRKLKEGTWPQSSDEIAIDAALAEDAGLRIGDTVSPQRYDEDAAPLELRVSGILTSTTSLLSGVSHTAMVSPDVLNATDPYWLVKGGAGTDPDQLRDATAEALSEYGDAFTVQTADDYAETMVNEMSGGVDIFRTILLVFGAIATVVGMLIIANTFTILIAQRRRQIGLLRAVGGSTGQVQREMLGEAFLLGAIGSALGVIGGIGLGVAAAAFTGSLASGVKVPWTIAISFAVGVLITVLAAWLPSLRTSQIMPMEALRTAATDDARARPGVASTIVSSLLLAGGIALLVVTFRTESNQVVLAVGAAALLALGVLLGAGWYVPGLLKALGLGPARLGPTPRLAVANAVRNPKRATATCLALMLAVGLVTTLQVGSASVKASSDAGIAQAYPVPLILESGTSSQELTGQVGDVDGVTQAITVWGAPLTLLDSEYTVLGIGPEIDQIVAGSAVGAQDILIDADMAKYEGLSNGDTTTVTTAAGKKVELTVRISKLASYGSPVVSIDTLRELAGDQVEPWAVWAGVDVRDADSARQVMDDVQELAPDAWLSGSLAMSTILTQMLDILLLVATGLLGAAVLIALIGVGNTLGLSVLERTRESGLLRALGLQRFQLRGTLAIEAVLLAVAGALIGVVAGVGFGALGTWAMMAEIDQPMVLVIPWALVGVDAVIAIGAGVLASVLPARRAVSVPPTVALAEA